MNIVEKKFGIVSVGVALMSEEYRIKLESDGYVLSRINKNSNDEIVSYTFTLKEDEDES